MKIIDIIQKNLQRELSAEVKEGKLPIYKSGVDSIEMIKMIIAIEEELGLRLDSILQEIETLTVDRLQQIADKMNTID